MNGNITKVHTFVADVRHLMEETAYRRIYEKMPNFRKEKADRLRRIEDKARSVGAWRLFMLAAERYPISSETPFNLSHSGNYALCSIAPKGAGVGCDVEGIRPFRESVAERFFCPRETAQIMALPREKRAEEFIRFWVLKESFMKATRRGMSLGFNTFEIDLPQEGNPSFIRRPETIKETYYFYEYQAEAARVAVCSTYAEFCPHLENIYIC